MKTLGRLVPVIGSFYKDKSDNVVVEVRATTPEHIVTSGERVYTMEVFDRDCVKSEERFHTYH